VQETNNQSTHRDGAAVVVPLFCHDSASTKYAAQA
jgi:hypothetical protein